MKKQCKYLILFAVLLFGTTKLFATTTYVSNGIIFLLNKDDGTAVINGYTDELPAEVLISDGPYIINGTNYTLTGINAHAFQNCTILRSLYIPDCISNIDEKAFAGCTNLRRILLGGIIVEEVPTVSNDSFEGVTATLIVRDNDVKAQISETWGGGSFTITLSGNTHVMGNYQGDGTLYIEGEGDMVLDGRMHGTEAPWAWMKNMVQTVIVGEGITSIGYGAFADFTSLTSVVIPQGVTSIDASAFQGCNSLVEIGIPSTVEYIGECAFDGCMKLEDINIETGSNLVSLGESAFAGCAKLKNINLPNTIQSIGYNAFFYCENLENINIPSGIRSIASNLFHSTGLTEISIPNNVTTIGEQAFWGCTKLTRVVLPESIRAISFNTFAHCSSLVDVELPNSVETIGEQAFTSCSSLKNIELPNSVIEIGRMAFGNCTQLESLYIPENVNSIGTSVIAGCLNLSTITVANGNEIFDSRDGCQAIIETATNTLIAGCAKTRIPETVTTIGTAAYINHSNITSLTIPENITTISKSAFSGCRSLSSLVFPSSISNLGNQIFNGCKNLKYIDLSRCTELSEITVDRSNGIFKGVNESTLIYLPSGNGHSAGGEKNVVIGGICEKISISDETTFESPTAFTADDASYDRTFTSGVTATVCLPYTIAAANVTGGTFYSFGGVSSDYVVTMNEVTGDILANTPYLFVPSSETIGFNGTVTVCIVNRGTYVSATQGDWTFCGTYEKIDWRTAEDFGGDLIYGFAANTYGEHVHAGDFVRVEPSNNSYINPYRAYLRYTPPSGAPAMSPVQNNSTSLPDRLTVKLVKHNGAATVIGDMERTNESVGTWYTVDGQRLSGKPTKKGVYINHGHKVIIK